MTIDIADHPDLDREKLESFLRRKKIDALKFISVLPNPTRDDRQEVVFVFDASQDPGHKARDHLYSILRQTALANGSKSSDYPCIKHAFGDADGIWMELKEFNKVLESQVRVSLPRESFAALAAKGTLSTSRA